MLRALIALLFFPTVTGPFLPGDIFGLASGCACTLNQSSLGTPYVSAT